MKVNQPGDPCNNRRENIEELLDQLEEGVDLTWNQKGGSDRQHDAEDFPFVSTSLAPDAIKDSEDDK